MKRNLIFVYCIVSLALGLYMLLDRDTPVLAYLMVAIGLGGVMAMACVRWVWPLFGEWVADVVYGDRRLGGDDPLEQLALEVRRTRSQEAMDRLRQYAEENGDRTRVWTECATLLRDVLQRPAEAAETLEYGASFAGSKEDRALLLYRAASLYDSLPDKHEKALQLWKLASERYPETTYGAHAAERLN